MKFNSLLISLLAAWSPKVNGFLAPAVPTNHHHHVKLAAKAAANDDDISSTTSDRRAFLSAAVAASLAGVSSTMVTSTPQVANAADSVDYKAVAADIASLVEKDPNWGPTMVRIAWHTCGTYDKVSGTGGSQGGTMRFKSELDHGGNAGLEATAYQWLEPIHDKYPGLSYGDLYTLSGVVAIKSMGGPTIPWSSGRIDESEESVTPDGRLPNADVGEAGSDKKDATHLRTIFNRMGFDDQEIVALSGAHALGRCHTTASGYDGPWTLTPTTFNNAYFTLLSNLKWIPKQWDGPYQYVDAPTGKLMMLPTDLVLLQDRSFKKYVAIYATDAAKFNTDFTAAFQKLEELGTKNLVPTEWAA